MAKQFNLTEDKCSVFITRFGFNGRLFLRSLKKKNEKKKKVWPRFDLKFGSVISVKDYVSFYIT